MVTEQWRYAGRRVGSNGKLLAAWETADGRLTAWPLKGSHRTIGSYFDVDDVERNESGAPIRAAIGHARFLRSGNNDETVQAWTVADRAAYAADELRALEARAKRDNSAWEDMTLAELRSHLNKVPIGQRAAMQAWITTYLQR